MSSKQVAEKKEKVSLPLVFDYAHEFEKDWTRLAQSGRYDMARLKTVMMEPIANSGPLEVSRRDHALNGDWQDYRECHIGGDFLLIYQKTAIAILFARAGSHADLFEN